MRRIITTFLTLTALTLSATACDGGLEDGETMDEFRNAEAPAEVTVVSWAHAGTSIRSKAHCDDFVEDPNGEDCHCANDSSLTGELNLNNGADKCVLCRWWQWENGDCDLGTSADVNLTFLSNGGSQYSYNDDGTVTNIDTSEAWLLTCEEDQGSCPCTGNNCSCSDESLDFAVVRVSGGGNLVSDPSSVIGLTGC